MSDTFRPTYRELTASEKDLVDRIKSLGSDLEACFEEVASAGIGREDTKLRHAALAKTALEEAVMWGVKACT